MRNSLPKAPTLRLLLVFVVDERNNVLFPTGCLRRQLPRKSHIRSPREAGRNLRPTDFNNDF